MSNKFVKYQKKGSIVIITINRPERLNALGLEVTEGIRDACKKYQDDKEARVAIITGAGRAFSAGADINEITGPPRTLQASNEIEAVKKPVIAAVNGLALGGGFYTVMACDIRIAGESASFGMAEIKGAQAFPPHRILVQRIPACIVTEIMMTGENLSAQRAYEVGLVNKVVPDKELMSEAMKMAEKIAALSPWAIRMTKEAKIKALALSKEQIDEEEELRLLNRKSEDFHEAARAFLQKRNPVFKGI